MEAYNEELKDLKRDIGGAVFGPLQKVLHFCENKPTIEDCLMFDIKDLEEDELVPQPDPELALGNLICLSVLEIINLNVGTWMPNYVDPVGNVHGRSDVWNIRAKYAREVFKNVLTGEQTREIAVTELKNNIMINKQTVAVQEMILEMAEK